MDWFYEKLAPIIYYIEKAFLLTGKTLFIIQADEPLKISLENIYKSNQQILTSEIWLEDKLYNIKLEKIPYEEAYMAHYRGWSIILCLFPEREEWIGLAVNTICYSHAEYIKIEAGNNRVSLRRVTKWLETKEELYTAIKYEIDEIILSSW